VNWVRVYYYQGNLRGLHNLIARYRSRVEALGDTRPLSRLLFWEAASQYHAARYT
jgi:hypothetical protein